MCVCGSTWVGALVRIYVAFCCRQSSDDDAATGTLYVLLLFMFCRRCNPLALLSNSVRLMRFIVKNNPICTIDSMLYRTISVTSAAGEALLPS